MLNASHFDSMRTVSATQKLSISTWYISGECHTVLSYVPALPHCSKLGLSTDVLGALQLSFSAEAAAIDDIHLFTASSNNTA